MAWNSQSVSGLRTLFSFLVVAALVLPSHALYFFIDGASQKCFFEELPKDTLVVGHYNAEQWDEPTRSYRPNPEIGVYITVEEVFDNDHRVVQQRGASKGRFTFSATDSGEHRLCFTPTGATSVGGWLTGGQPAGGIKFQLDLVIGETSKIESTDKGKIDDIVQKVKDLNGRLQDIRREQIFQREREAEFRDQSESTNARVVRWTLIQLAILGVTCAWQLSHLRAFFIKQKLT
ncbi:putative endosomal cargo receptor [Lepidopterella palustris CBS 459.81]|uniref:Putative endosomal cargo receptor n=1 Tax=Lepidopterella palustris CBS 459.81 TaxID=1314670 RepID=A0A8E2E5A9_9PEZI|nr:putative endosomal cargo receptor [Lepidopterella palustris CBS 459.81]